MNLKQLMSIVLLTGMLACNGSTETENHGQHRDEAVQSVPAADRLEFSNSTLGAIHQHYVHLTAALVNGDMAEAKIASSAIEAGAGELSGGSILASNARAILSATKLEEQRKAYSSLSDEMIRLVKESGIKSGNLYVEYCPMAMNDKGGYWLSNDSAIRNPYFGDEMMACGEVKEVLHK